VDAIIAIFFPKSLNIPYLELHNSLKEKENWRTSHTRTSILGPYQPADQPIKAEG
jgi:hypothetical protein